MNANAPNDESKNESAPVAASVGRIEWFARRLLERIGGAIDFALRRGQASPRTDLVALVPQLERAIEANLRELPDGVYAPHLLELRYDYETYRALGQQRRAHLERHLSENLGEYVHNRRYRTRGAVQVTITYDAFTRGLQIKATFGDEPIAAARQIADNQQQQQTSSAPVPATPPAIKSPTCELTLRVLLTREEHHARVASNAEPIGIGRNAANTIVLRDPSVSNFHAAFLLEPNGTLAVADRTSANGTYVNGTLIETGGRSPVRDGDRVRFGEVETIVSLK